MCCDEFFEKIKVVINCVTRSYQRKLNSFEIKTSCGPNNSANLVLKVFAEPCFKIDTLALTWHVAVLIKWSFSEYRYSKKVRMQITNKTLCTRAIFCEETQTCA